jgi:hypothetical protein
MKLLLFVLLAAVFATAAFGADPMKICQVDAQNKAITDNCWEMSAGVVAALEKYAGRGSAMARQEGRGPRGRELEAAEAPAVPAEPVDVFDYIMQHNVRTLVVPALRSFPPPEVQALKDQADAAAKAAVSAETTVIKSVDDAVAAKRAAKKAAKQAAQQ